MLEKLYNFIMLMIDYMGLYGPIFGCLLIIVESIIPVLPLSVFITINFMSFGTILGFIVSWICTLIGCSLSFYLFRHYLSGFFQRKTKDMNRVRKIMRAIDKAKFQHVVLFISIPFTPAFLVNIACGLSTMKFKKFFIAILIGKVFLVLFWGFVGTTLIQSLTDPIALVKVILLCIVSYVVSLFINKKFNLD